ncbi:hypothetical protein GUJ93_ZPchr0001g31919 [Zizania palustris]|uniref:Uncharacterized protein n=1 Tax=Zizania palustris TaxID=103762 RepID=A0A8J5RN15_ZIZPA|nr:hypothetical protein GUJ93_ZPchr0001g31919 [Zizania palustris]
MDRIPLLPPQAGSAHSNPTLPDRWSPPISLLTLSVLAPEHGPTCRRQPTNPHPPADQATPPVSIDRCHACNHTRPLTVAPTC